MNARSLTFTRFKTALELRRRLLCMLLLFLKHTTSFSLDFSKKQCMCFSLCRVFGFEYGKLPTTFSLGMLFPPSFSWQKDRVPEAGCWQLNFIRTLMGNLSWNYKHLWLNFPLVSHFPELNFTTPGAKEKNGWKSEPAAIVGPGRVVRYLTVAVIS